MYIHFFSTEDPLVFARKAALAFTLLENGDFDNLPQRIASIDLSKLAGHASSQGSRVISLG